jgi:hypothetical protein
MKHHVTLALERVPSLSDHANLGKDSDQTTTAQLSNFAPFQDALIQHSLTLLLLDLAMYSSHQGHCNVGSVKILLHHEFPPDTLRRSGRDFTSPRQ